MRKTTLIFLFLLAAIHAPCLEAAQPASLSPNPADQFIISMTSVYPSSHPVTRNVLRPWAESVMEDSGGRLVIRIFEPNTVADSSGLARSARLGQVGIAVGLMDTESEDFQLSLLAAQAMGSTSIRELSLAYWRMYSEIPELASEFAGIKLLAVYATAPYQLCMTKDVPYNAESLAGKRFLADSPLMGQKLDAFGAFVTIVPQPYFKMYMGDKVADGAIVSISDIVRLGLADDINGVTLADLENGVMFVAMHQGVWDMLPQDLRNILNRSIGPGLSQKLGESVAQNYRDDLESLQADNIRVHYFSAEERARFEAVMKNVSQRRWQDMARDKGYNVRSIQDKINKIMVESSAR